MPKPKAVSPTVNNAYKVAKDGGKHAGLLKNYSDKPRPMITRAIHSMEKQIDLHHSWIKNPYIKLKQDEDMRRIDALVNKKWPDDINRINDEADVLRGLLQEKK
jgi:hypothetical protein